DHRNSGREIKASEFRFQSKRIVIDDIEAIAKANPGTGGLGHGFHKRYPNSWGYVFLALPGYAQDGKSAVAVLRQGPSFHGIRWIFQLEHSNERWKVIWRRRTELW